MSFRSVRNRVARGSLTLAFAAAFALPLMSAEVDAKPKFKPITDERIKAADSEMGNWLTHGRTYDEQRYSTMTQINEETVQDLGLQWSYEYEDNRGLEGTPVVADGVIYTVSAWSRVYAHDAKTGDLLWRFDPEIDKSYLVRGCCGPVSRGLAIWGDNVYLGAFDGHLIALNRRNGELVWKVKTAEVDLDYTITGAPRVVNGKVIIGNGGAEYGVRGYITAYDAVTGEQAWRFYTVPGNPELGFENEAMRMAAETWTGKWWEQGGGGTVWDSMAFDPELNLLYIGVGNGSPWNHNIRSPEGGDNLFLSSIVAVDADTGEYRWHYQSTPAETWDFTATQHMILAEIEWEGEPRKVIMQAPKNGFFFVVDRVTGEYLSAEPFTKVAWAKSYDENGRPIEEDGVRFENRGALMIPSAIGGHNWHSMAYNPQHKLVYIPVIKTMMEYQQPRDWNPKEHVQDIGVYIPSDTIINQEFMQILKKKIIRGETVAWDPEKQERVWTHKHARTWNGGLLATAGNLVFQGTADNKFMAFKADTGEVVWQQDIQLGVVAAPITYAVDGEQYIAIMAKWGGAVPMALGVEPLPELDHGRLLVFKLGGKATLPQATPKVLEMPEALPAIPEMSEQEIQSGKDDYIHYCSICHGNDVVAGNIVPDLRYMSDVTHQNFNLIVRDGAFKTLGMDGFGDRLSQQRIDQIYAYILTQAHAEKDRIESMPSAMKIWFYHKLADFIVAATDGEPSFYIKMALVNIIFLFLIFFMLRKVLRKLKAKK